MSVSSTRVSVSELCHGYQSAAATSTEKRVRLAEDAVADDRLDLSKSDF